MRIGGEIQRKEKEQRIAQIYTQISIIMGNWKNRLKSRSTVIRHLTRVRETSKTKITQKNKQHKNNVRKKNQSLYTKSPNLIESFSTKKFQRCITDNEVSSVIKLYHSKACGSQFSSIKTTAKILQNRFYWPTMFKDTHAFCKTCEIIKKLILVKKFCFIILDSIYFLKK